MRNHCHRSGNFRGVAHEDCNLEYKVPWFSPVIFHILSGYGNHLFIKTLGNSEGGISCILNNEKNFISFTKQVIVDKFVNKEGKEVNVKRELRVIDSLRFMQACLDKLSSNLNIDLFVNLKKYHGGIQLSLLLRQGVYPIMLISCKYLMKQVFLRRNPFTLNSQMKVLHDDYQHDQTVWKEFNIELMKEYYNLYNMFDVLQLRTDL